MENEISKWEDDFEDEEKLVSHQRINGEEWEWIIYLRSVRHSPWLCSIIKVDEGEWVDAGNSQWFALELQKWPKAELDNAKEEAEALAKSFIERGNF